MKDINVAQGIVTLGDFKAKAATMLRELGQGEEPMVITQNGRPAAVMMSPAAFEAMRDKQRLLEQITQGVQDIETGRVVEHGKVRDWLKTWGQDSEGAPPSCS